MNNCIRYRKGDNIENALSEFRRALFVNNFAAMEAQPGDGTRYFFVISRVEIPACGHEPQFLLSYSSDTRSLCMQLGPDRPYLVPSYMIEKCPGVNPHTACLLCEMVNRIFQSNGCPLFDLEATGRPTDAALYSALAAAGHP